MANLFTVEIKNYLNFSITQNQEIPQFLDSTVQILHTVLEMSDTNTMERLNDEIHSAVLQLNSLSVSKSLIVLEHLKDQESFHVHMGFYIDEGTFYLLINTVSTLG